MTFSNEFILNKTKEFDGGFTNDKILSFTSTNKKINKELNFLHSKRFRGSTDNKNIVNNEEYRNNYLNNINSINQENIENYNYLNIDFNNDLYLNSKKISAFKLKKALFESPFISTNKSANKITNELTNKRINKYEILNGKTVKLNLLNLLDCMEENNNQDLNSSLETDNNIKNKANKDNSEIKTSDNIIKIEKSLLDEKNSISNKTNIYKNNMINININNFGEKQPFNQDFIEEKNMLNNKSNTININISTFKNEDDLEKILEIKKKIIFTNENMKINAQNENSDYSNTKPKEHSHTNNLSKNFINLFNKLENNKFDVNKKERILNKLLEENKKLEIDDMLNYIFDNKLPVSKLKNKNGFCISNINCTNDLKDNNNENDKDINKENIDNRVTNKTKERTIFCTCKKTNCSKYYCFCLKNGLECGANCSCNNCDNKCKKRFSRENNEVKILEKNINEELKKNSSGDDKANNSINSNQAKNELKSYENDLVIKNDDESVSSYKFSFDA